MAEPRPEHPTLAELFGRFPRAGEVRWIGVRPGHRQPVEAVDHVQAELDAGLEGDRFSARPGGAGRRQVTLIQAEHLPVIAALAGMAEVDPAPLRRNLVVGGINLHALKQRRFAVGDAVLAMTGECHPCSRMEEALGDGGYNAMRGMGGWNARVEQPGRIQVGDAVRDLGPA